MIKRINKIRNLGVFNNYQRDHDINDFKDKNIIYGWNYTGKTTLSRLFNYLNNNIEIDDEYNDIEFEIELYDGSKITQNNRVDSTLIVRVFNSDFVRDNLRFDIDGKIKGITFDIGEGGNIRAKILENKKIIEKARNKQLRNRKNINLFNDFEDSKFSREAKRIKNDCFNSLIEFNKGHLKSVMNSLYLPLEQYSNITPDELTRIKSDSLAIDAKPNIDIQKPTLTYIEILKNVVSICETSPIPTNEDSLLSKDKDLFEWGKRGIEIYNSKIDEIKKCAFCGQELPSNRLEYLNNFYTNEAAKLKERIDCAKSTIDNVKNSISTLEWSRKSKNDLVESCQNDFSELISQYKMLSENYCNALDKLVAYLNKKFNSLFVKLNVNVNDTAQIELGKWIDNVENVFIRHNKIVSNFDKNRNLARDKYKQYLVATFLITENYYKTKRFSEIENRGQEKWQSVIDRKERENIELSNQLKSITKGKEQLNIFIYCCPIKPKD